MTAIEAIAQAEADAGREERELYAAVERAHVRIRGVRTYVAKLAHARRYAKAHPDASPEDVEVACGVRIGNATAFKEWLEAF